MGNKEDIQELEEGIKDYMDLEVLANTNGGKTLIKALRADIVTAISQMAENRQDYTLQQFVSSACDIKSKLDIVKSLTRAASNREELEKMLEEKL